ncbi:XRE family transcriptional regulator [Flavobacterium chilense]|uniref:Zn-dependent peptidase ImmA, M78 family n=1 Tax=Flavobacterium chilense TaxID=946677 RepID=A0A1M7HQ11_9FLAO|nr:XRE family transcriptional regulator [Flavobacterium chilense]SHM30641.1 Zn-dependent peptidase ImmA, M78 family [Flavobacterium chilense]
MSTINIERIKLARESRGYSQSTLAKEMKSASQVLLSKIEKGLSNVTDDVFTELSLILDYPKDFFYKKHDVYPLKHFYFRKNLGMSMTKARLLESQINILSGNICDLLDAVEIEIDLPFTDLYKTGLSPEQMADRVRDYFNLPKGPIKDLIKVVEQQGVIIHFFDFTSDLKISGVSYITPVGVPVMILNKNMPNSRKVFTIAHELGHILMHFKGGIISEDRNVENEADRFASSFLMPSSEIKSSLYYLTDEKLGDLKRYWKVSIQALLFKAKDTGALTQDQYRRWVTKISYYGWRKQEPLEFEISEPKLLYKMLKLHFQDLQYSKNELCEMFGLNEIEFDKIYLQSSSDLQDYLNVDSKVRKLKVELDY